MWITLAIVFAGALAVALVARHRERVAAEALRHLGDVRDIDEQWQERYRIMDARPALTMRFRERLALVLFLAPIVLGMGLMFLLAAASGDRILPDQFFGALRLTLAWGALLGGSAWVLFTTLKWLVTGRT